MLELDKVTVTFKGRGRAVAAVKEVSLKVAEGEVYGIIGTSGAGKSTLLRTINALERPTSGRVLVQGEEVNRLSGEALRRKRLTIGMVFQHFELVGSRSVAENIALPMKAAGRTELEISTRIDELLGLVELLDKKDARPDQLSGGQKQRVGIARALANRPSLLLCDEPTSALDLETTEAILDLLAGINRRLGVTLVVISHEMAVIKRICHRVAVMQGGQVVEENDTYSLFSDPRHPLSRELVEKSLGVALPERIAARAQGLLLRLVHLGFEAEEAVLTETARELGVHINILHGRIEYINGKPIGILLVEVGGSPRDQRLVLEKLRKRVAKIEVLAEARTQEVRP
jgi:D-methionine transport system ATP-binding protein